jgi:hypothetical protein
MRRLLQLQPRPRTPRRILGSNALASAPVGRRDDDTCSAIDAFDVHAARTAAMAITLSRVVISNSAKHIARAYSGSPGRTASTAGFCQIYNDSDFGETFVRFRRSLVV